MSLFAPMQAFPVGTSGLTSGTSVASPKLGTRARDAAGNEFQYVDFQQATYAGEWVVIDSSFAASRPTSTSRGPLGVVIATPTASDYAGWVQIYGVNTAAMVSSDVTTAGLLYMPVTSEVGMLYETSAGSSTGKNHVFGAIVTTVPSSIVTSAAFTSTSEFKCTATVILNYPFLTGHVSDIVSSA